MFIAKGAVMTEENTALTSNPSPSPSVSYMMSWRSLMGSSTFARAYVILFSLLH